MIRLLAVCLLGFTLSAAAFASWYYNEDGGIGAYQPDGWQVEHNGRSSRLTSPGDDGTQSSIFFGSDWVSHVDSQSTLRAYVEKTEGAKATAVHFSDLDGFRTGTADQGALYLLREKENVIVIEYDLRGKDKKEARTVLESIEVRTDGLEYP